MLRRTNLLRGVTPNLTTTRKAASMMSYFPTAATTAKRTHGTDNENHTLGNLLTKITQANKIQDYDIVKAKFTHLVQHNIPLIEEQKRQLLQIAAMDTTGRLFNILVKHSQLAALESNGNNMFHFGAASGFTGSIDTLADMGVARDQLNEYGETPLFTAIRHGQVEFVKKWLETYGGTNNTIKVDNNGKVLELDLLGYAVLHHQSEMLAMLLEHPEVQISDRIGITLKLAVWSKSNFMLGLLSMSEKLLAYHVQHRIPVAKAVCFATAIGNRNALKILAKQFPEAFQRPDSRYSPLHRAVESKQPVHEIIKTINCLLRIGANARSLNQDDLDIGLYVATLRAQSTSKEDKAKYERISNRFKSHAARTQNTQYNAVQYRPGDIRALVFSGGGPKGVAYVGIIEQLTSLMRGDTANLARIERVAGTSAGSIVACLIAVGYTASDLRQELLTTSILDFIDSKTAQDILSTVEHHQGIFATFLQAFLSYCDGDTRADFTQAIKNLNNAHGLCAGDTFHAWIEECVRKKVKEVTGQDIPYLTFGELHKLREKHKTLKELHVVATDLSNPAPKIRTFSSEDPGSANIIISYAIRASMSIPGLFTIASDYIKVERDGVPYAQRVDGTYNVDGGLVRNRPLDIFDRSRYVVAGLPEKQRDYPIFNERVVGFTLNTTANGDGRVIMQESATIAGHADYLKRLASTFTKAEILLMKSEFNDARTIAVDCGSANLLSFHLTETEKSELIAGGANSVSAFFKGIENSDEAIDDDVVENYVPPVNTNPAHQSSGVDLALRSKNPIPLLTPEFFDEVHDRGLP